VRQRLLHKENYPVELDIFELTTPMPLANQPKIPEVSMKTLPKVTDSSGLLVSLVLRTDFSDDAVWESVCTDIQKPDDEFGFEAHVHCVSNRDYDGLTVEQLISLAPEGMTFLFIADRIALNDPEHPILVVDLHGEPGRTFRVVPSFMWAVENNLSLANTDFYEMADSTDLDGILRGFPKNLEL
jgi:hypothetical protein